MFKIILISILGLYVAYKLFGIIFRAAFWLAGKKVMKDFQTQQGQSPNAPTNRRKEGEIHVVDPVNATNKLNKDGLGEYIDFEEVD